MKLKYLIIPSVFVLLIYVYNNRTEQFSKSSNTCYTVLNYNDFGFGDGNSRESLIGRNLWQWQNANEDPNAVFNINIVVYAPSIYLLELKKKYKTSEIDQIDYRYLALSDLEHYLNSEIIDKKDLLNSCKKYPNSTCEQFNYIENLKNIVYELKRGNCMVVGE